MPTFTPESIETQEEWNAVLARAYASPSMPYHPLIFLESKNVIGNARMAQYGYEGGGSFHGRAPKGARRQITLKRKMGTTKRRF